MKLQNASREEIKRIAMGTAVLDILMAGIFTLLSRFDFIRSEPAPLLLSALIGSLLAVFSFTLLCITVQRAVQTEDRKKMQAGFRLSYNIRMILQAGWVVICLFSPRLNLFAGAIPLTFPKITILYLAVRGAAAAGTYAPGQGPSGE